MKQEEKELQKPAEERLSEDELEAVAGGQIELVQDGPVAKAGTLKERLDGFRVSHHA